MQKINKFTYFFFQTQSKNFGYKFNIVESDSYLFKWIILNFWFIIPTIA